MAVVEVAFYFVIWFVLLVASFVRFLMYAAPGAAIDLLVLWVLKSFGISVFSSAIGAFMCAWLYSFNVHGKVTFKNKEIKILSWRSPLHLLFQASLAYTNAKIVDWWVDGHIPYSLLQWFDWLPVVVLAQVLNYPPLALSSYFYNRWIFRGPST